MEGRLDKIFVISVEIEKSVLGKEILQRHLQVGGAQTLTNLRMDPLQYSFSSPSRLVIFSCTGPLKLFCNKSKKSYHGFLFSSLDYSQFHLKKLQE